MTLSDYLSQLQFLLNDPLAQFFTTTNLTTCINIGRGHVAKKSRCIRLVTPSSASLSNITVTAGGSGYSSATVTISGPDAIGNVFTKATATANISGGAVASITVNNPGTGYVKTPTVTITGTGTGATATAALGSHWTTTLNQEVYSFAGASAVLQATTPGVGSVIAVEDMAISWQSMKPMMQYMPWSSFQAYARAMNQGASTPAIWSQFGRDEGGSAYLFPIPSDQFEMQWDCYCTPADLSQAQTVDLIPANLNQAVLYYAAYYAYMNAQRKDDAEDMYRRYDRALNEAAMFAQASRTPTYYPSEF